MVDRCSSSHYSTNYPSFSSTLLDAICRSIEDEDNSGETETMKWMQNNHNVPENCILKSEEANYRRACMIEKWMEKIDHEFGKPMSGLKVKASRNFSNEKLSLSSNSNSRSSSSSSSSSFSFSEPKPVRTGGCSGFEIRCVRLGEGGGFSKTKSMDLKIRGDLKKAKQPISPGAKITGFFNSLFSNGNPKKMKKKDTADQAVSNDNDSPSLNSTNTFSRRSCLSKKTASSYIKSSNKDAFQRSVRFSSVSMIIDEGCESHGHKAALDHHRDEKNNNCKKTDEVSNKDCEDLMARLMDKTHLFVSDSDEDDDDDDDDDDISYASSDLFELDNLSSIGLMESSYGDDLPVYETTCLRNNRVI